MLIKCPKCPSENIARVFMGEPTFDEKLVRNLDKGKIRLGGCLVSENGDPDFFCNNCKHQWRRDGKKVQYPISTEDDWLEEDDN